MRTKIPALWTKESNLAGKQIYFVFLGVLIITAIIFSGSLKLDWTNWDDHLYVYKNPVVSEGSLKEIFTIPGKYNTYNPLVIASFALEWKLVKDSPFLYHLDNVLLHLLCTALALWFFRIMGLSVWWSGFAALLFGIHPMRVESVAWVTERKDTLCALFYLASMIAYIHYITSRKKGHLLFTFIFFILSFFSKAQALTLPFALILLDVFFQRKIGWKVIVEKASFLIVALAIFLPQCVFFSKFHFITTNSKAIANTFDFWEQVVLGGYVYTAYILKSIFPYVTCAIYPVPAVLEMQHWFGAAVSVVLLTTVPAAWRKYGFVAFGLLFFTFNVCILILLSFVASDVAFLNDHYTYIAYLGLFFVMAMSLQRFSCRFPSYRLYLVILAVIQLAIFSAMTIKYIPVWQNSETLWTYVINKYPNQLAIAHLNRGQYRYQNNQKDKALEDFNTAIVINPDLPIAFQNRGLLYLMGNDFSKALEDYTRYLGFLSPSDIDGKIVNPAVSDVLGNRGLIYIKMGQYDKALADYDLAIKINPSNINNYLNRALTYMQLREYDKAIRDFNLCHQSDPRNSDIINNRGVCHLRSGHLKPALDDFNKAILLNDSQPAYYINRAITHNQLGFISEAKKDVQAAEQRGATVPSWVKK